MAQLLNLLARRVLPIPISPRNTTSWGWPAEARAKLLTRVWYSFVRPVNRLPKNATDVSGRWNWGVGRDTGEACVRMRSANAAVSGSGSTLNSTDKIARQA